MKVYVVEEARPILDEDGQEAFISHIAGAFEKLGAAHSEGKRLVAVAAGEGEPGTVARVHEMEVQP